VHGERGAELQLRLCKKGQGGLRCRASRQRAVGCSSWAFKVVDAACRDKVVDAACWDKVVDAACWDEVVDAACWDNSPGRFLSLHQLLMHGAETCVARIRRWPARIVVSLALLCVCVPCRASVDLLGCQAGPCDASAAAQRLPFPC